MKWFLTYNNTGLPKPRAGLRYATHFKWRDALSHNIRVFDDVQNDIVALSINTALWHCMYENHGFF